MSLSLNIKIVPWGNEGVLLINGQHFVISPATMNSPEDLRRMLVGLPDYVYDVVVAMLKDETEKMA